MPPAPPAYVAAWPAAPRSPSDAPAEWLPPAATGRPFTPAQEASRWLAAGGQGAMAVLYVLAATTSLSRLGGLGGSWGLASLALQGLLVAYCLRIAWTLVTRPDQRTLQSAVRLSLVVFLFRGAGVVGELGDPFVNAITLAIVIALALVPGTACVLAVVAQRVLGDSIPERAGGGWG